METIGYKCGKQVELIIGKDYYNVFFAPNADNSLVYAGNDKWIAKKNGVTKEFVSKDTSSKALDYVIRHVQISDGTFI